MGSTPTLSFSIGLLAQSVEQRTFNPWVEGSIPSQSINYGDYDGIGRHIKL